MKILLVLLYLWRGDVVLEKDVHKTLEACQASAAKRVQEIQEDPRFVGGFGAWCIKVPVDKSTQS